MPVDDLRPLFGLSQLIIASATMHWRHYNRRKHLQERAPLCFHLVCYNCHVTPQTDHTKVRRSYRTASEYRFPELNTGEPSPSQIRVASYVPPEPTESTRPLVPGEQSEDLCCVPEPGLS
ncbi:hypothetical protein J6590_040385 [Homalodisca vitripennis]|nr:hypothetical protein J6590_040385 [Homalodisca vitripennis]